MDYDVIKGQAQAIIDRHTFARFNPSVKTAIEAELRMWLKNLARAGHMDDVNYFISVDYDTASGELSAFVSDRNPDEPLTFIIASRATN